MAQPTPPEGHPEIDYTKWTPPGEGDVRSPCPMINALANHGILPHDGKGVTKEMAVKALTSAVNLGPNIATVFAVGGVASNPDHSAHSFNLDHVDKHNFIEHDVSLSRGDIAFGSNSKYAPEHFNKVFDMYCEGHKDGAKGQTTYASASKARYARVVASKEEHEKAGKEFHYGIKELIMSYGETALFLSVLGKDGVAPLEWVKIFFEEERLPYNEGWRPPTHSIDQPLMNKTIFNLIAANEHKGEEARQAGVGTIQAMKAVVESFIKFPSTCSVM